MVPTQTNEMPFHVLLSLSLLWLYKILATVTANNFFVSDIFTGSGDGHVRAWSVRSGKEVCKPLSHASLKPHPHVLCIADHVS